MKPDDAEPVRQAIPDLGGRIAADIEAPVAETLTAAESASTEGSRGSPRRGWMAAAALVTVLAGTAAIIHERGRSVTTETAGTPTARAEAWPTQDELTACVQPRGAVDGAAGDFTDVLTRATWHSFRRSVWPRRRRTSVTPRPRPS